jgi:hypothetical protein
MLLSTKWYCHDHIRSVKSDGALGCNEMNKTAGARLIGKPKGKEPLECLRRRWHDNIKMGFKRIKCEVRLSCIIEVLL